MMKNIGVSFAVFGWILFLFSCGSKQVSFSQKHIGDPFTGSPKISNLTAVDLDKNSLMDVVVADMQNNSISWIRQQPAGIFKEIICADNVPAPSHIEVLDFDGDDDLDIIVAVLGVLFPNNDKIGSVLILENDGEMNFIRHPIIENIYRVSDARAADFDGDGDLDLAVTQFGYSDGETCWLENEGDWNFKSHVLQNLPGVINSEIADIDKDNDADIITIVSQHLEEIYLFKNDGNGRFEEVLINGISNDDFGSSGISLHDLDNDGDLDILYTNGDAFDYVPPMPRPWHGVNWLENKGDYIFEFKRIADLGGAYNAAPVDYDHDGDLDIFAVSTFNNWSNPQAPSLIYLENDGAMNFRSQTVTTNPTHILALDVADINNDGEMDLITGGMHVQPPDDRMARIMLWENNFK